MNKKLQKLILKIIKENNGKIDIRTIENKATINYWDKKDEKYFEKNNPTGLAKKIIRHQLDLLEVENKIIKQGEAYFLFYVLSLSGYQEFDSWYKKIWRFILYDKNNLFVLFSLIIAIISLIFSILANQK